MATLAGTASGPDSGVPQGATAAGNGGPTAAGRKRSLLEFLQEAGLHHHYGGMRDVLRVYQVSQLKYVTAEDLIQIGMSKPEARRLKNFYQKHRSHHQGQQQGNHSNHHRYTAKIRQFLLPGSGQANKDSELLLEDDEQQPQSGACTATPTPVRTAPGTTTTTTAAWFFASDGHEAARKNSRPPAVKNNHLIPAENVSILGEIGEGEFGVVQQGVLRMDGGNESSSGASHPVAVKCLSKERMQNDTEEFLKEFHIMQSVDHPNILRLFGAVLEAARIMLVTELAPLRSLLECLKEATMRPMLTIPRLADFAGQIGAGMEYLEQQRLIHRDLAARNILVFSEHLVKVSDFGLSRALGVGKDYYQTNFSANLKLPIAWCAPECITFLKFTSASDVWAFGVTLWEMFSYGFQPWAAFTGQQILESIDRPNCQRLEQPILCPAAHFRIMQDCWHHEPSARPNFSQILLMLEDARPAQVEALATVPREERGRLKLLSGQRVTILDRFTSTGLWKGVIEETGRVGLFDPALTAPWRPTAGPGGPQEGLQEGALSPLDHWAPHVPPPPQQVASAAAAGVSGDPCGSSRGSSAVNSPGAVSDISCLSRHGFDLSELVPLISTMKVPGSSSSSSSKPASGPTRHRRATVHGAGQQQPAVVEPEVPTSSTSSQSSVKVHEYQSIVAPPPAANQGNLRSRTTAEFNSGGLGDLAVVEIPLEGPPPGGPQVASTGPADKEEASGEGSSSRAPGHHHPAGAAGLKGAAKGDLPFPRDFKGFVNTLSRGAKFSSSRFHHSSKKCATVRPIKASDERTLESAIAMANALASKSMHDLDKRHLDGVEYSPTGRPHHHHRSPLTPGSPNKKFFWFPSVVGRSSSPGGHHHGSDRGHHRPFLDEATSCDVEKMVSAEARDAYKALIEGGGGPSRNNCWSSGGWEDHVQSHSPSPTSSSPRWANNRGQHQARLHGTRGMSLSHHHLVAVDESSSPAAATEGPLPAGPVHPQGPAGTTKGGNPLPLPPRSGGCRLDSARSAKRHVRKNPLIMPAPSGHGLELHHHQEEFQSTWHPSSSRLHHQDHRPQSAASNGCKKDAATFRLKKTPGLTVSVPRNDMEFIGKSFLDESYEDNTVPGAEAALHL